MQTLQHANQPIAEWWCVSNVCNMSLYIPCPICIYQASIGIDVICVCVWLCLLGYNLFHATTYSVDAFVPSSLSVYAEAFISCYWVLTIIHLKPKSFIWSRNHSFGVEIIHLQPKRIISSRKHQFEARNKHSEPKTLIWSLEQAIRAQIHANQYMQ